LAPLALSGAQKKLSFVTDLETGLELFGDRAMIETALRNLVSNAAKFSWPGQTITIRGVRRDSEVVLEVKDEGSAMSPEVLSEVLRSLRAPTRLGTAGERGSGLGLSLVRQFAARHRGRFELESAQGIGTVARLVFPAGIVAALNDA
jgi:signal transduction histidine kinase